ncbi:portal protein [Serratia phage vB_SmaM_Hera]|uniref:Portal protein n=1 Tax=Serratia phage vB_SmaM_Hera TaxID=2777369 RepID=A0A7T3TKR1_9CAUD|nr:portal protein [Serratia phage vB_SmaM_Hera]
MKLFNRFLRRKATEKPKEDVEKLMQESRSKADPLDVMARTYSAKGFAEAAASEIQLRDVSSFPMYIPGESSQYAMDGKVLDIKKAADDGMCPTPMSPAKLRPSEYSVPDSIQGWYMSQGFIGYQACALIAQHWLVDKACTLAGEDAVRNGWTLKADGGDELTLELKSKIDDLDIEFGVHKHMTEMFRFTNIFGIRVLIYVVDSDDPLYYEKPFNIDGVTKGSYRGISQIDPYWMTPMLTSECMANPASIHFYDPEFWMINGLKYHRSHLIISRTAQPADILKPTYYFGGIPLVQRIYERVYAAERTANEAPLLAMNKRTTAIHVDLEKAVLNEDKFLDRIRLWVKFRDNHAVKVLGMEETLDQFDTSLADFDSVIMNQYQLVASIAKTPATKLLGTSPKGFNATGEFETISYHEELESIQANMMTPFLNRHYLLLMRSEGIDIGINIVWEPVDSITTQARAEMNDKKAQTGVQLITAGVISPDEERNRLKSDKYSGYNLTDGEADKTPGFSPENIAQFQEAGAEMAKGVAAIGKTEVAEAKAEQPAVNTGASQALPDTDPTMPRESDARDAPLDLKQVSSLLRELHAKLDQAVDVVRPEGGDVQFDRHEPMRSVGPSVRPSVGASVAGMKDIMPSMSADALPKMKISGMNIVIENPKGSIRKGQSVDGEWSVKMPMHYGYIKGTVGADGDEVDCFVGPDPSSQKVYVVNQKDVNSNDFDEHKVMFGYTNAMEAKEAYKSAFNDGWTGYDGITGMPMDQFKRWLKEWDMNLPAKGTHSANPISPKDEDNAI